MPGDMKDGRFPFMIKQNINSYHVVKSAVNVHWCVYRCSYTNVVETVNTKRLQATSPDIDVEVKMKRATLSHCLRGLSES